MKNRYKLPITETNKHSILQIDKKRSPPSETEYTANYLRLFQCIYKNFDSSPDILNTSCEKEFSEYLSSRQNKI